MAMRAFEDLIFHLKTWPDSHAQVHTATCLQCRAEFISNNKLHEHIRSVCWASIYEAQYSKEWTPSFTNYIRRALDPRNSTSGWFTSDIISELKSMIEANSRQLNHVVNWDFRELPQHKHIVHQSPTYTEYSSPKRLRKAKSPSPRPIVKQYPAVFEAPYSTPRGLFNHERDQLFVAHRDGRELMIYTDGACSNNGQRGARAGCAFVFRHVAGSTDPFDWDPPEGSYIMNGAYFFRLEDKGADGSPAIPTSNRAELRAVVAALAFFRADEGHLQSENRCSGLEFWHPRESAKLVIVTDSSYVVDGATKWSRTWEANGWKKNGGEPIKNQDLWELLLERIRILQSTRCRTISFWLVPRSQNEPVDQAAKYAVTLPARRRFGIPRGPPAVVDTSQVRR